jgi:hypothetical protein
MISIKCDLLLLAGRAEGKKSSGVSRRESGSGSSGVAGAADNPSIVSRL